MPTLEQDIVTIRNAIYGKDMREAIAEGFENTQKSDSAIKTDLADTNKKVAENTKAIGNISVVIGNQAGVNYDETDVGTSDLGRIVNLNCLDKTNSSKFNPMIFPNVPLDYTSPTNKEGALSVRNGVIAQNTNWFLAKASLDIPTVSPGGSAGPSSQMVEKMFTVYLDEQPLTLQKWKASANRIPEYWAGHLRVTSNNIAIYESSNSSWATAIMGYYNSTIQCIPEVMIVNSITSGTENGRECIYIPAFVRWPSAAVIDHDIADQASKAYTIFYLEYVSGCLPGNTAVYN